MISGLAAIVGAIGSQQARVPVRPAQQQNYFGPMAQSGANIEAYRAASNATVQQYHAHLVALASHAYSAPQPTPSRHTVVKRKGFGGVRQTTNSQDETTHG